MNDNQGELVCLHVVVRGRVQGVNFRAFVRRQAASMDLTGYVRNLPTSGGEVEVWSEGPRDKLERLVELLHEGPRASRVDDVEVEWLDYSGDFPTFDIRL